MAEYDAKINWVEFYSSRLKNVQVSGNELKALCPFHQEKEGSFTANLETGLWKCYGCDKSGNGQTFLELFENMNPKKALETLNRIAGITSEKPKRRAYTVDDYAKAKRLPVEFLKQIGLRNSKTGISISYMDESGAVTSTRQRYGDTTSGPRFTWTRGSKVSLYGLWKLPQIREDGYVILVEGESDCHTLWFHGYPALGAPGASVFQPIWAELLKGLKLYIFQEPDVSGETFIRRVSSALVKSKWDKANAVLSLSLLNHKDPSELHCADPEKFKEHWDATIKQASELDYVRASGSIENSLSDAPVQLRQAPEWRFTQEGIFTINEKTGLPVCISPIPVLLSRRLRMFDTGQEKVEICYRRDGQWRNVIYPRSTLFQSRTITQLSDLGITVTSENAKALVRFLAALEAENIDLLERVDCVSQLGWFGKQFVPGCAENIVIDVDPSTQKRLDAYYAEGTLTDWIDGIGPCRDNEIFRLILAASFAAPLLRLLNHRIFIVHNWGETRIGKTAALKAALSVWGEPDGLMASFYATRVGLERLAGFFRDLPLGIDEKQVVGRQDFIDNLMYMLSLGTGKVRGAKTGGLQAMQGWRTIILTTGEEPLTSATSHSGMYSRVLEIYGPPFNNEDQAKKLHTLSSFGCAGPEFIRHVTSLGANVIRTLFEEFQRVIAAFFKDKIITAHVSALAVIASADAIISELFWKMTPKDAFGLAFDMAVVVGDTLLTAKEADLIEQAYLFICEWLISNHEQFTDDARSPRYGFVENEVFYVFPQALKDALERNNFSYRSAIKGFSERGYLAATNENRNTVLKRMGDHVARFFAFSIPVSRDEEEGRAAWWDT